MIRDIIKFKEVCDEYGLENSKELMTQINYINNLRTPRMKFETMRILVNEVTRELNSRYSVRMLKALRDIEYRVLGTYISIIEKRGVEEYFCKLQETDLLV